MLDKAVDHLKQIWTKLGELSPAIRAGYVLTALWLVLLAIYITFGKGWGAFWGLSLSDLGDFLSGAFAPLAFFWLVIAVLLQTAELGLQREELRQSREALEEQAAETRALVEQNKRSVEVATAALAQQQIKEREAGVNQTIDALGFRILGLVDHAWISEVAGGTHLLFGKPGTLRELDASQGRDAVIASAHKTMKTCVNWASQRSGRLRAKAGLADEVRALFYQFRAIQETVDLEPPLVSARARAYSLDIGALVQTLEAAVSILERTEPA